MPSSLIDPFGDAPEQASCIAGLGGAYPPIDTSYAFRTTEVKPALGEVTFTIKFQDLKATCGTIILQVTAVSGREGADPIALKTVTLALKDLAATGGVQHLAFQSRRDMLYGVAGNIYDETDATATAISITLDRWDAAGREGALRSTDGGRAKPRLPDTGIAGVAATPRLLSADPPKLRAPVSQGWTPGQCADPCFAEWMGLLRQPIKPTASNWTRAYILQALRGYGALRKGAAGLGLGEKDGPLPALLTAQGCRVTTSEWRDGQLPDAALPESISAFDFAWSIGAADHVRSTVELIQFIETSISLLKPRGLMVHILPWTWGPDTPSRDDFPLSRPDIERLALNLISLGHEVAQLKFGSDHQGSQRRDASISPFGLIMRRC